MDGWLHMCSVFCFLLAFEGHLVNYHKEKTLAFSKSYFCWCCLWFYFGWVSTCWIDKTLNRYWSRFYEQMIGVELHLLVVALCQNANCYVSFRRYLINLCFTCILWFKVFHSLLILCYTCKTVTVIKWRCVWVTWAWQCWLSFLIRHKAERLFF